MATAKKNDTPDIDFDAFDEESALQDSAEAVGVQTAFKNGVFWGKFRDGTFVHMPLDIPRAVVEDLDLTGLDAFDQLSAILDAMELGDQKDKVLAQGLISSLVFAQKFFDTIQKVTKVSLGK